MYPARLERSPSPPPPFSPQETDIKQVRFEQTSCPQTPIESRIAVQAMMRRPPYQKPPQDSPRAIMRRAVERLAQMGKPFPGTTHTFTPDCTLCQPPPPSPASILREVGAHGPPEEDDLVPEEIITPTEHTPTPVHSPYLSAMRGLAQLRSITQPPGPTE